MVHKLVNIFTKCLIIYEFTIVNEYSLLLSARADITLEFSMSLL